MTRTERRVLDYFIEHPFETSARAAVDLDMSEMEVEIAKERLTRARYLTPPSMAQLYEHFARGRHS